VACGYRPFLYRTQELERLEPDAGVFKLVGPVLVRQDLVEARANVTKRLEYISGERRVPGCVSTRLMAQ
jgi:prefoldin beta subunit